MVIKKKNSVSRGRSPTDVDLDVDCHFLFSTMADAGSFNGTSTDQDRRFSDAEAELLKSMEFPSSFDKKVR